MKFDIDIETYKSKFGCGARAYMFYVNFNFPGVGNVLQSGLQGALAGGFDETLKAETQLKAAGMAGGIQALGSGINVLGLGNGTKDFPYYVKSTVLPDSTINETLTYWQGTEYKIGSTQRFTDWTVSLYVDKNGDVLKKFRDWQDAVHTPESNIYGKPVDYMCDQKLYLISGENGEEISEYKLVGAWPKSLGQVSLDYGSNEIATFDVTFSYQYHVVTQRDSSSIVSTVSRATGGALQSGGAEQLTSLGKSYLGI